MSKEIPVDYDNRSDPDCPTRPSSVITNIICFLGEPKEQYIIRDGVSIKLDKILREEDTLLHVWSSNFDEQCEARLTELGWELRRIRPWKE